MNFNFEIWRVDCIFSLFCQATECNQEECVKLLLEHRAEVDAIETEGNTGLHLAVKHGFLNIAVALISAGANLNLKNKVS